MPISIQHDNGTAISELRIEGILKRSEFASCEQELTNQIAAGGSPRLLVILYRFAGWESNEDWNNLDFMFTQGDKIGKIAVVGAGAKEAEVRIFTGAGMRPTPVEFFPSGQLAEARAWLQQ